MNPTEVTVSVENISPEQGISIAALWFAFHDGSFDLFDAGSTVSAAMEIMAEDGLIGLEATRVADVLDQTFGVGADPEKLASVRPENTIAGVFAASEAAANGGIQDVAVAPTFEPAPLVLNPGQSVDATVTLDNSTGANQFFSYTSMVFPTNDGFLGNDDPTAIEVFDSEGNFIETEFIIFGNQVWDAGVEVNDEDPLSVPYTVLEFLEGVDENGTVQPFPGFLPPGEGGIIDLNSRERKFLRMQISQLKVIRLPVLLSLLIRHLNWG